MKKIATTLILSLALTGNVSAGERSDVNQLLKEIHYIKEVTKKLKQKYKRTTCPAEKVCFRYDGLLGQLSAAEYGIKEYLNGNIQQLHIKPKPPVVNKLYRVRKN